MLLFDAAAIVPGDTINGTSCVQLFMFCVGDDVRDTYHIIKHIKNSYFLSGI